MATYTNDHRFFDATETVELLRKTSTSGDDTADSIADALRQDVFSSESGGAIVGAHETVWHLPAANVTNDPRPGDVIRQSGGTRWTITDANRIDMIGSWECKCVKEKKA